MYEDENLYQQNETDYYYYEHSNFPLVIELNMTKTHIRVKIQKYWKNHLQKELEAKSKILAPMNKYQIEDYILDQVYKFIEI